MSYARSSGRAGAGAGDPSIKLGNSSSTCSLKGDPGESSKISSGVRDWLSKKSLPLFGVLWSRHLFLSYKNKKTIKFRKHE